MRDKRVSFILFSLAFILLGLLVFLSLASSTKSVTLAGYRPTPRPSEPCDICEPNNSLSQACGPLAPGEGYQYRCTNPNDHDYYYVDLDVAGTLVLSLTHLLTDYDVYVYDEYDHVRSKCSSAQYGNVDEIVICDLDQPGRYYVWVRPYTDCIVNASYTLSATYPTPPPTPVPTPTPTPLCNHHIDDFQDSGCELYPPGCGHCEVHITGSGLQLDYDLTASGECTATYSTQLSLDASPYEMLTFVIRGDNKERLASTRVGLRDKQNEVSVQVGDFLNQIFTNESLGVNLALAALATIDVSQLDSFFIELTNVNGNQGTGHINQGTLYLDNLRLERPLAPLIVDNFNDQQDPNALNGASNNATDGVATITTAYVTTGTYDNSAASYAISYTVTPTEWALWETDLPGVDVSDYDFLSFYIKGAEGGEKVNLYLQDTSDTRDYVDLEAFTPIITDWLPIRMPLQEFEGVNLAHLDKIKFAFEWDTMTGTIFLDDLRFVVDTLLVDNFCDDDRQNSLNGKAERFDSTSNPTSPCPATITSALSGGVLQLDYDVTAGLDCFAGYWSHTRLDLNPYRTLAAKVRGERCGQVAAISASTIPVNTDKLKVSDFLLDGLTDQWQTVRIPLAASSVVTDWTQGDAYVIAFEAHRGAAQGTTWWDDVTFETACATLWVDNFDDQDDRNALGGSFHIFSSTTFPIPFFTQAYSITQAYGDAGAGLVLTYAVPEGKYVGWETDLRNADLSNYGWLIFNIKGPVSSAKPNVYLQDSNDVRVSVPISDYVDISSAWQTAVIPLSEFSELDLTQIKHLQIVIEWETIDIEGTLVLDNIRFLPSADCSQIAQNLVFLPIVPIVAKNHTPLTLNPIWDFEADTQGWIPQTRAGCQAVIAAESSSFRSRHGDAALAMTVDLIGGDKDKSCSETFVDLYNHPPLGIRVPLNLSCKPLTCWVYVPTCALGDPAEPNLAQLFVQDEHGKKEYGTLTPVVRNQWFEVELRPSTLQPHQGSMDPGFDPSRITQVGVQFRAGSQETTYQGKVYIDACDWQD